MKKLLGRCIVMIVRPPLLVVRMIANVLYPLVFGRSERRHAEEREVQLAATVREVFSFLFADGDAKILGRDPTLEFPPPFDLAYIFVAKGNVAYRFIRGKEEEFVSLRHVGTDNRWIELSLVLGLVEAPEQVRRGSILDFRSAARLLKSNLKEIEEAFSDAQYAEFKEKVDEVYARDRIVLKQRETELNRHLYG